MTNFDKFLTVAHDLQATTGSYTTRFSWVQATSGNMQMFEMVFYDPKCPWVYAF